MSRPESETPDRPFPGAHSQVPGARQEPNSATTQEIPLEASPARTAQGWSIRLPVRAENVRVSKRVVTYERVTVRRRTIEDTARVEGEVRREVLRVKTDGDVTIGPADRSADEAARRDV